MRRITGMFVCISLLLNLSFTSYASERLIPSEGNEYQEILSMKDEVLYHINYGGARGELNGMWKRMRWKWKEHIKFMPIPSC